MNLDQLLKSHFSGTKPDNSVMAALEKQILGAVHRAEEKRAQTRAVLWAALFIVSAFGFIWSGATAYAQFVSSGSSDLVSVALSDSSLVLANGSDFLYSLAETLPLLPISSGLAAIALLLTALRHLATNENTKIVNTLNYGTR